MAVALDTYDQQNGIHPRNKQLPAMRLAAAGLAVAYNTVPQNATYTRGPFPRKWEFMSMVDDSIHVRIGKKQLVVQSFKLKLNDTECLCSL